MRAPEHVGDERALDDQQVGSLRSDGHEVARLDAERRDVDATAVHGDMAVTHLLTSLGARLRETETVHDVVETALQDTQQVLARHALLAVSHIVVMTELLLQDAVDALGLLLLAQLVAIFAFLDALLAGLARRVVAALDRALLRVAAIALKEKLRPFTTAQTAVRSSITSHNS